MADEPTASEQILAVLEDEKRVNPLLIRERTGLRKQTVNRTLTRLQADGRVDKVCRGLYEIAEGGDDE